MRLTKGCKVHDANLAKLWHVPEGAGVDHWRLSRQIYGRGSCPAYILHGDADSAVYFSPACSFEDAC